LKITHLAEEIKPNSCSIFTGGSILESDFFRAAMNLQSVPFCPYSIYHGNKLIWKITEINASQFLGVKNPSMSINVFTFPWLIHNFAKLILEILQISTR
jgi:hypothetical protein